VIAAASVDANSISADDFQSIVAVKCFFTYQRLMMRLGIPATRVVAIRPIIPCFGISSRLSGNPIVAVISVSFRVTPVFPICKWSF